MKTRSSTGSVALIILAIVIALFIFSTYTPEEPAPVQGTVATATFACAADKTITAAFYRGEVTPPASANEPPIPGGSVALTLSDGRAMALTQTISADGARYANADESVVFWNKGNGVTFTENAQQTYRGCIVVADDPGGLPQTYENGTKGFSIRYPSGFVVNDPYTYQELGPGKDIGGVKFTIPTSLASGTNLAADTYVSVEQIPQIRTCSASLFLDQGPKATSMDDDGITYSVASSTGAAAGNRYEEIVYAMPDTNPCIAVRYFIHYGAFQNFEPGTVEEFDEQALLSMFDSIRRTLTTL